MWTRSFQLRRTVSPFPLFPPPPPSLPLPTLPSLSPPQTVSLLFSVSDAWLSSTLPSTSREERIEGGRMDRSISHPAPSYMVHYFISLVFFITFYIQNRSQSPSFQLNVPPHFSSIVHDFTSDLPSSSTGTMHSFPFNIHYPYLTVMYRNPCSGPPPLPDSVCPYPPADVSRVTVTEIKETDTPRGYRVLIIF